MNPTFNFPSRRSTVLARRGMVATSQPLAAQAGLRVLQEGGNAADAAVATAAALNVVEPISTGIGGDVFVLAWFAHEGRVVALNGSGRAPQALSIDWLRAQGYEEMPQEGVHSITVPGAADAWEQLLQRYGRRSLAANLQPAVELAEQGFAVSELIAAGWAANEPKLKRQPGGEGLLRDGRAPRYGEVVRMPELARTFRLVGENGAAAFYTGEIGQRIVAFVREHGGLLSMDDMARHASTWEEPISTDYRGYTVYECPPNGQGLAALLALNIIAQEEMEALPWGSSARLHVMIEAMRLAFADAWQHVGDPACGVAGLPGYEDWAGPKGYGKLIDGLLSMDYARRRRALIRSDRALPAVAHGFPRAGTVYLTVVDGEGNGVSFINSNYAGVGSGIVVPETGVALQNRGALFSLDPSHPNALQGGKRPYHTIIPCLVLRDEKLWSSLGVMGGFMQPQGHLQVLSNLIDYGMSPQQALDAPRFQVERDGKTVGLELGFPPELVDELRAVGHEVRDPVPPSGYFGGGQVIVVDRERQVLLGGSDPRKDGCAVGW